MTTTCILWYPSSLMFTPWYCCFQSFICHCYDQVIIHQCLFIVAWEWMNRSLPSISWHVITLVEWRPIIKTAALSRIPVFWHMSNNRKVIASFVDHACKCRIDPLGCFGIVIPKWIEQWITMFVIWVIYLYWQRARHTMSYEIDSLYILKCTYGSTIFKIGSRCTRRSNEWQCVLSWYAMLCRFHLESC